MRLFGVEIELNSFDKVEQTPRDKLPSGIHYVANLISKNLEEYVEVRHCGYTHWNKTLGYWVVKPDNSCGIEVCSPISQNTNKICQVIDLFHELEAAENCSFHIHVDISDLSKHEIINILKWWIKCEPIFFASVPEYRKCNKYVQFIGLLDSIEHDSDIDLIEFLGIIKYFSINTYHYLSSERDTLEFRIGDNTLCKDSFSAKNWIKLILNFVEVFRYKEVMSLEWLEVDEFFEILKFQELEVRDWFLGRLII